MHNDQDLDQQPVIRRLQDFDTSSGNLAERALFNFRPLIIALCLMLTALLGWQATHLRLNASFDKMIPTSHPYVRNYLEHRTELSGLGNSLRIAVAARQDNIFDARYLATLQKMNDEIYPAARRRPAVHEIAVDRQHPLDRRHRRWAGRRHRHPRRLRRFARSMQVLRANVERSGEIGQIVAANFQSSDRCSYRCWTSIRRPARLRQDRRRPDRRLAAGAAVLRGGDRHRQRRAVLVHALLAQHPAGGGLFAGGGGVAARPAVAAGLTSSIRIRCWCPSWCSPSA
jgi:hypothetical protein